MSKCQFKIMNNNFITKSLIDSGHITFSSETTLNPFGNAFDNCRSSVWRPNGSFKISSSNNIIKINGNQYIIPFGVYTKTTLVNIINTLLIATDILISNVNDFFIFSKVNAGNFSLNVSAQLFSAWKTLGFYQETGYITGSNINPISSDVQKIHEYEEIILDLSVPTAVDFVAGIYLIDKDAIISNSAKIKIQGDNLPERWDNPEFEQELQVGDKGFYGCIDEQYYRYWRLEIKDQQNHLGYIELTNLYIGSSVDFHAVAKGISRTTVDNSSRLQSENGSLYHFKKTQNEEFSNIQIDNMNHQDRLKLENVFNEVGTHTPFFVSLDPFLDFSKEYSDYTRFVRFKKSINKQHLFLEYYTPSFSLIEVI